jgi:hypothetical protein
VARAIEYLGTVLTSEGSMVKICKDVGVEGDWPSEFQLVFRVKLERDELKSSIKLLDCWPRPPKCRLEPSFGQSTTKAT